MANRRKFLALLGFGAASGPLAVKAAADAEFARMAGITGLAAGHDRSLPPSSSPGESDWEKLHFAASKQASKGLPAFAERQLRERSQYVHSLDPDLAAKRSWSMSVKILTQRQRNYERQVAELKNWAPDHLAAKAFKQLTGYRWPW